MPFNTIEEIIDDFRQGKLVLLVDDEDRENEGDLLIAAEKCTPDIINFMAREARGLICLTLTDDHCVRLGLEQMVPSNRAPSRPLLQSRLRPPTVSRRVSRQQIELTPF